MVLNDEVQAITTFGILAVWVGIRLYHWVRGEIEGNEGWACEVINGTVGLLINILPKLHYALVFI